MRKRRNEMQQYKKTIQKMVNYDDVTKKNTNKPNSNWSQIPDPPYSILVTGGSGSKKTNALLNLIK